MTPAENSHVRAVTGLARTLEPFVGWNQVDAETAARAAAAYLREAGLLVSGGSGEAPAGLTEVDFRALEVAVWIAQGWQGDDASEVEKQKMGNALAKLRAALRGPVAGEVAATESGEGNDDG